MGRRRKRWKCRCTYEDVNYPNLFRLPAIFFAYVCGLGLRNVLFFCK